MASSIVSKRSLLNSGASVYSDALFREFGGVGLVGLTLPMPPAPVGGDSIGAVAVSDGFVSFVTDAQGKGTMASRLGAKMRRSVLSAVSSGATSTTAILQSLNRTMIGQRTLGAAAILHYAGWRLTVSVAGFPAPALFHPDGRLERFPITGTILGLSSLPEFDIYTRDVMPSTFVMLFSDGVTEAEAPDGEVFEVERFSELLDQKRSLAANLLHCVDTVLMHSRCQQDDLSILIAHIVELPGASLTPRLSSLPS